jgi:AcrR family transcriptional regulator
VVRDVLAATLEAFVERGYAGLSIEDVAHRAGVNKTTVYRRWPTRAELVGAALFSLRNDTPELPDTGSLREDLFLILKQRASSMVTPQRRAIVHAVLLSVADPELQTLVSRLRLERPVIPALVIQRAIDRGELPRSANTELMIEALLGTLHSRTYWRRQEVTDDFLSGLIDLVVSGCQGKR